MTPQIPSEALIANAAGVDAVEYADAPDLALAAVLQLLSSFPARRSPVVARAIAAHLAFIGGDARMPDSVRACASRLVGDWRAYAVLGESWSNPRGGGHLQ